MILHACPRDAWDAALAAGTYYGPIPVGAVVAVHPITPEPDGSFLLPVALRTT